MWRRWIIRGFFLFMLLLCVGGWGWSTTHSAVVFSTRSGPAYTLATFEGMVQVGWVPRHPPEERRVYVHREPLALLPRLWFSVGLGYGARIGVPYWMLILAFGGPLPVIWRKTRGKRGRETAFPVEVGRG